jgi:hypothetical protein
LREKFRDGPVVLHDKSTHRETLICVNYELRDYESYREIPEKPEEGRVEPAGWLFGGGRLLDDFEDHVGLGIPDRQKGEGWRGPPGVAVEEI